MDIWYARDRSGDRLIYFDKPEEDIEGFYPYNTSVLIDHVLQNKEIIDKILGGPGVHGLRKGGLRKLIMHVVHT